MIQLRPTADTATKARRILDGIVKANVSRQRFSTRIVVLGNEAAARLACQQLGEFGFRGAANSSLSFTGVDGRYQIFAYEVRR